MALAAQKKKWAKTKSEVVASGEDFITKVNEK